jgi:hypothetical protein
MTRLACDYYRRSKYRLVALCALALAGCGGANQTAREAPTLAYERLQTARSTQLVQQLGRPPYIIKVAAGTAIPVDFDLDSRVLAVRDEDFVLVAKRDFYLLMRADGPPLLSEDGVEFEDKPRNYFRFGFRLRGQEPTTVDFALGVRPEKKP